MEPEGIEGSPEISIRPYQHADRSAIYRIAGDTAFFGAPIETFLEDRRIFLDSFYRYYTDFEPESAWVAVFAGSGGGGDGVAGFLTGCQNTARQQRVFTRRLVPDALWGALTGRYRLGSKTWRYVWRLSREAMMGRLPEVDLQAFPAHLHINVDASWRGRGIGRRLLLTFLEQLRLEGIPGVHLETTSQNAVACRLYERLGFRLASSHPTRLWKDWIDHSVEIRVYTLRLENFQL